MSLKESYLKKTVAGRITMAVQKLNPSYSLDDCSAVLTFILSVIGRIPETKERIVVKGLGAFSCTQRPVIGGGEYVDRLHFSLANQTRRNMKKFGKMLRLTPDALVGKLSDADYAEHCIHKLREEIFQYNMNNGAIEAGVKSLLLSLGYVKKRARVDAKALVNSVFFVIIDTLTTSGKLGSLTISGFGTFKLVHRVRKVNGLDGNKTTSESLTICFTSSRCINRTSTKTI